MGDFGRFWPILADFRYFLADFGRFFGYFWPIFGYFGRFFGFRGFWHGDRGSGTVIGGSGTVIGHGDRARWYMHGDRARWYMDGHGGTCTVVHGRARWYMDGHGGTCTGWHLSWGGTSAGVAPQLGWHLSWVSTRLDCLLWGNTRFCPKIGYLPILSQNRVSGPLFGPGPNKWVPGHPFLVVRAPISGGPVTHSLGPSQKSGQGPVYPEMSDFRPKSDISGKMPALARGLRHLLSENHCFWCKKRHFLTFFRSKMCDFRMSGRKWPAGTMAAEMCHPF